MPRRAYDNAVRAASEVLHLRLLARSEPDASGRVTVDAEVAAVLRGPRATGTQMQVTVATPPERTRPGPVIYRSVAALDKAGYAEAHLNSAGRIAGQGAGLILLDEMPDAMVWTPMDRRP